MARYYFNVYNNIVALDEDGEELRDLEAVQEAAFEKAHAFVREKARKRHRNLDHRIEVTNEAGTTVLVLTFRGGFTVQS